MIELLVGGAIALTGVAFGRVMPNRRRKPKTPKAICGCTHHYSMHDPKTGECHGLVKGGTPEVIRDSENDPVLDDYGEVQVVYAKIQCGCKRYTGPEPLPSVYAQEITGGDTA